MATLTISPEEEAVEQDEFAKSLPYDVVPTNVKGAYALKSMPEGVDLNTAGPKTLLRHGFPYRRPSETDLPGVQAAWKKVFGRETPLKFITPQLRPRPGVTHHLRRRLSRNSQDATAFLENAWAGGIVAPAEGASFTAVTASFDVSTVSMPSEDAGTEGGWHCATWVGLDGFTGDGYNGTTDVLQGGVEQKVDAEGNTSCYAWFEWYVDPALTGSVESISINKSTLSDLTPLNTSIAAVNGSLYMAHKDEGSDVMVISHSSDGQSFSIPVSMQQASQQAPSICEWNGGLYMAWKNENSDNLNVAHVSLDPNSGDAVGLTNLVQLGDTSQSGPALCSLGQSLFLAWRGDYNNVICVMQSLDGGATWGHQIVLPQYTSASPAITVSNGDIVVAWADMQTQQIRLSALALDTSGFLVDFGAMQTVDRKTTRCPALAGFNGFLFVSWSDEKNVVQLAVAKDGLQDLQEYYTSSETSTEGMALAVFANQLFISWKGNGNDNINVSPVTMNYNEPEYRYETVIDNFPVKPGDNITATVSYQGNSTGSVFLTNNTTGIAFSVTLQPPPGADFSGQSMEWIVEAPDGGEPTSALPKFTEVDFSPAFGCGPNHGVDPQDGDTCNIQDSAKTTLTAVTLSQSKVSVSFIG